MERGIENYLRYLEGDKKGLYAIVELYWNSMLLFTNGYVHNRQMPRTLHRKP